MLPDGRMEGFGIVLLEATLVGTPVAVSTQGGMSDFVLTKNGMYFDVDSVTRSEQAVSNLLENEPRQKSMVTSAQNLLLERLLYPQIAGRISAALDS